MTLLSRDQILESEDIKTELVDVPEWGGKVGVRMMTGTERDEFEAHIVVRNGDDVSTNMANFRAKLCASTMVNENGNLYFPNPEDVKALGKKSAKALDRVFAVAQKINGMGREDVEELTKNLSPGQSEDSTSD